MINVKIEVPQMVTNIDEAFKTLRTNLKFCSMDKKVIGIVSCNENEGKSTVSLQLAKALADAGDKVCLLDCDLRKSYLLGNVKAKMMSSDDPMISGLSHYLSGQASINDILAKTNISNLYMIFAGPTPPNPAELLSSKKMASMIKALEARFDYIIVDTEPIGPVIDGVIIAGLCDGALLVIENEKTSYRLARRIKKQVEKTGCPVIGVVMNKVNFKKAFTKSVYGKTFAKQYGHYHS